MAKTIVSPFDSHPKGHPRHHRSTKNFFPDEPTTAEREERLMLAIDLDSSLMVRDLIDKYGDSDKNFSHQALVIALLFRSKTIVRWLLDYGVDRREDNGTALILAALTGDIEMLRLVVKDHKFDLLAEGIAALRRAASIGPLEILQFLLSLGDDTHPRDVLCAQHLALVAACNAGNRETAYFLSDLLGENVDLYGARAMIAAARGGHLEILRNLLRKSAGIDNWDHEARSRVLTAAIESRQLQLIQYLSGLIPLSESGLKAEDIPDPEIRKFRQLVSRLTPQSATLLMVEDKIDQEVKEYLQFWHLCESRGLPRQLVKTAYETGAVKMALEAGLILNAEEVNKLRAQLTPGQLPKDLRI